MIVNSGWEGECDRSGLVLLSTFPQGLLEGVGLHLKPGEGEETGWNCFVVNFATGPARRGWLSSKEFFQGAGYIVAYLICSVSERFGIR